MGENTSESVWDYPRPPRVEPTGENVTVVLAGITIAQSRRALRVLETSHPPVYYLPFDDVASGVLEPSPARPTFCEFKGVALYWTAVAGGLQAPEAAWSYPEPSLGYEALVDHVAFYPERVEACFVDGERVESQPGSFYGGWVTSRIRGPFKGAPGTAGW
jgi:uncharacterized protein (DUF427 family)